MAAAAVDCFNEAHGGRVSVVRMQLRGVVEVDFGWSGGSWIGSGGDLNGL